MDLARALTGDPPVRWIIGRVKQVTGDTITMTYRGGDVTAVSVIDQYVPKVGDVVHVLASDLNGMLAIGSNNQSAVAITPTTPRDAITAAATSVATYQLSTNAWTPGVIRESPDHIGLWLYPSFATTPGVGYSPLARFTIRITTSTLDPLEFVLHSSVAAAGVPVVLESYRVAAPPTGVATDVPLPLDWGSALLRDTASGVGIGGGRYTALLSASTSGLLTFTPLL